MMTLRFLLVLLTAVLVRSAALAQDIDIPPGATYCVAIVPTYDRPCVQTPQWNEWQIFMFAQIVICYESTEGKPMNTPLAIPVSWYRKLYGSSSYEFWRNGNTLEIISTDGHRCSNGDPLHDATWQVTFKAVVNIQGKDYVGYLTVGGPAAETYPCCPGLNCNPPSPPPCL